MLHTRTSQPSPIRQSQSHHPLLTSPLHPSISNRPDPPFPTLPHPKQPCQTSTHLRERNKRRTTPRINHTINHKQKHKHKSKSKHSQPPLQSAAPTTTTAAPREDLANPQIRRGPRAHKQPNMGAGEAEARARSWSRTRRKRRRRKRRRELALGAQRLGGRCARGRVVQGRLAAAPGG